ncbi:MAG: 16S rRNA processing protein RimM, partial [Nitrospirae bacterium]
AALWAERDALPPLEAGAYYVADLVGLAVETLEGAPLGTLAEVIETGAADVWVVRGEAGELLLPATREVVRRVDLAARRVVVAPLPGMVP